MSNLVSLRGCGVRKLLTLGRLWASSCVPHALHRMHGLWSKIDWLQISVLPNQEHINHVFLTGQVNFLSLSCLNCKNEKTVYQLDIVVALNGPTNVVYRKYIWMSI